MITTLDKNTALILIDLQNSVLRMPLESIGTVLENAIKLVHAFHHVGLPVIIVNVNTTGAKWTSTRKDYSPARNPMPADSFDIVPEIGSIPDNIYVTKHTWGAFFETGLEEELQKRNITGIVIGGIATSIGVEGTARQASERGYNLTFAKDAMTDIAPEAQERSLRYIFPRMGEVDDTDRIIEKLSPLA